MDSNRSRGGSDPADHGRRVLEDAERESQHLKEVLVRSRQVRNQALPVLRRAGYLR